MDFIIRTVILLGIITVCVILASTTVSGKHMPPVIDMFTSASAASTDTCSRVLVKVIVDKTIASDRTGKYDRPEEREKLYQDTAKNIDQYLTLDPISFLRSRGVDTTKLPQSVTSSLPPVKLTDLVNKFQPNNVIDDSGNVVSRNECLIPMSIMKQFRGQTPQNTIQLRNNISDKISKDNKQCKIGTTLTTTNIPQRVTSQNDDFTTIEGTEPKNYGFQSFGCVLPTQDVGNQNFINMLTEMYSYTDSKTMSTFKTALDQYSSSLDTLNTAATNNMNAYDVMVDSAGELARAEALAQAAKDALVIKQGQTAQAEKNMKAASEIAAKNTSTLQARLDLLT